MAYGAELAAALVGRSSAGWNGQPGSFEVAADGGKNGYAAYLRDSTPSTMARRREELKNHG